MKLKFLGLVIHSLQLFLTKSLSGKQLDIPEKINRRKLTILISINILPAITSQWTRKLQMLEFNNDKSK